MDRLDRSLLREHSTTSARVQAYAALREAIVRAELEPGRQLSENELAARLGVSRTPIREALVRLRDERLVEIVPQLGTFVTRISTPAVADAQFIREALECACVRRAAELATEDDVAALEDNLRAQERARDTRRLRRVLRARRRVPPGALRPVRAPRGLAGQPARARAPEPGTQAEHARAELSRAR